MRKVTSFDPKTKQLTITHLTTGEKEDHTSKHTDENKEVYVKKHIAKKQFREKVTKNTYPTVMMCLQVIQTIIICVVAYHVW
jgi:hypothetical protein